MLQSTETKVPAEAQGAEEPESPAIRENIDPVENLANDPQSELSLDEPPEENFLETTGTEWSNSVSESSLTSWWSEFAELQSMRTASLMKTIRPKVQGKEVVVVVPPNKVEALDNIKFPFNRFIREKSGGLLESLHIEAGEIEESERRPYTDKEKLEFLLKKHPELEGIIQKLGLRLP